ncbi:TRADD-N-associated membrane domain-containing protein [Paenibacillus sp. IHBB 10380]|uniref:TRADD-N-associated membrane domain-containing protein n=1 Tax=Paenibacillus sp. IHBB 10380 TaxID=1566358 RepID=UPI000698F503|nr:hypothetical protein [Paenibacillus sp. IHBB 10380]
MDDFGEIRSVFLQEELTLLEKRKRRKKQINRLIMLMFCFVLILIIVSFLFSLGMDSKTNTISAIGLGIATFMYPIMVIIDPSSQFDKQIFDIKNEIDLLRIGTDSMELRAEKQFRVHQSEIKRYYDQSLSQSKWIFLVGIISLVAGMAIIILTLVLVFNGSESGNNVIIATTGGITGILTNFIAVIFLKMYSETVKSLNIFHNRLVATHHLHFSNFLISQIFDESLRERTWAKLALSTIRTENEETFEKS